MEVHMVLHEQYAQMCQKYSADCTCAAGGEGMSMRNI
jgi:hypothetical protein